MTADGNFHHRHVVPASPLIPVNLEFTNNNDASSPSTSGLYTSMKNQDHEFGQQFATALTIAGMGLSLLLTVFALFHVDVFLRVYRLPLRAYSTGNLIITVVNTANDLLGAYLLDAAATKMNRSDFIGISGAVLALCFL